MTMLGNGDLEDNIWDARMCLRKLVWSWRDMEMGLALWIEREDFGVGETIGVSYSLLIILWVAEAYFEW